MEEEQWLCQTWHSRTLDECIQASEWSGIHAFLSPSYRARGSRSAEVANGSAAQSLTDRDA
jgi:hypothetical protein